MEPALMALDPPPDPALAIPAALLVQTPLQDVLAALVERLRGQHVCIVQLQATLAREQRERLLLQDRVDFVVKRTEDGNRTALELTDDCLRKFEQKLTDFTRAADAAGAASKQALLSRIAALEEKLGEVDNLGGHCEAVRDIAGVLGMAINTNTQGRSSSGSGDRRSSSSLAAAGLAPIREESGVCSESSGGAPMGNGAPGSGSDTKAEPAVGEEGRHYGASGEDPGSAREGGAATGPGDAGPGVGRQSPVAFSSASEAGLETPGAGQQGPAAARRSSAGAAGTARPQSQQDYSALASTRPPVLLAGDEQAGQQAHQGMPTRPSAQPAASYSAAAQSAAADDAPAAAEPAAPAAAAGTGAVATLEADWAVQGNPSPSYSPGGHGFVKALSMAARIREPADGAELEGRLRPWTAPMADQQGGEGEEGGEAAAGLHAVLPESSSLRAMLNSPSGAVRKVADVVNMLRRRPSIKQTGLLWKLQASLHDTVLEVERLQREVDSLRGQLDQAQQASTEATEGLQSCNEHIDRVEDKVEQVQSLVSVITGREASPTISFADLKVLEDRVNVMSGQVADGAGRIAVLEEQMLSHEASATAASLLTPDQDSLAVLQSHLLSQQQKLQKYMDSLAANIQGSVPDQVNSAVNATVLDISRNLERRLADKLASKNDIQALSIRVSNKISHEEVERMLRKVQQGMPQAHAPASGTRLKCISCDSDLAPVIFAAAPGTSHATADLRYSQLPSISPARQPDAVPQPRPASPTGPLGSGLATAQPSAAALSSRAGTPSRRAGMGAPVGWLHHMRRDSNASSYQVSMGTWRATGEGYEMAAASWAEDAAPSPGGAVLGLQQEASMAGEASAAAVTAARRGSDAQSRSASRDGGLAGPGRRTVGSIDGGTAASEGLSPSRSKLALPALGSPTAGSGSPSRIRALPLPSRGSLTGGGGGTAPPPLASESSLTVQPVVPLPHPKSHLRPQTASPQKAALAAAPASGVPAPVQEGVADESAGGAEGGGLRQHPGSEDLAESCS